MAHQKPIVGVNADYRADGRGGDPLLALAAGYCDRLVEAGAVPVVLPIVEDADDVRRMLGAVAGLVLVGGDDLDPRRDGWMLHNSQRLLDPRREIFDRRAAKLAAWRRLPVLGIGAGMQLLNVSEGGTLFLHIPEDRPRAMPHRDPTDPYHRHGLEVAAGSILFGVYGEGEIRVTSRHHMAVDDVAEGFEVAARAPDGIVEAIESIRPDWWALGVQFHPECRQASALDLGIFEEFVAAVRRELELAER